MQKKTEREQFRLKLLIDCGDLPIEMIFGAQLTSPEWEILVQGAGHEELKTLR